MVSLEDSQKVVEDIPLKISATLGFCLQEEAYLIPSYICRHLPSDVLLVSLHHLVNNPIPWKLVYFHSIVLGGVWFEIKARPFLRMGHLS